MGRSLQAIRFKLITEKPYLASAVMAMYPVKTEQIPTLAVDKYWRLYYNPNLLDSLPLDQCTAVLEHEVWHLLRKHFERFAGKTPIDRVNIAEDCEINDDLPHLPQWAAFPKTFGLDNGHTAEWYFGHLPNEVGNVGKDGKGQNCGSGAHGQKQSWEKGAPSSSPNQNDEGGSGPNPVDHQQDPDNVPGVGELQGEAIRNDVARKIASSPGNVAGNARVWAEKQIKGPKPDWRRILRNKIRRVDMEQGAEDYTYSKLSRKSEAFAPFIMPSMRQYKLNWTVVIDTSGSMMGRPIARAMYQLEHILNSMGKKITVICADWVAYKPQTITDMKQLKLEGGGGTSMTAGIMFATKQYPKPSGIIVVTDGETDWPQKPINTPVVALLVENGNQHFKVPKWIREIEVHMASEDGEEQAA